MVDLDTEKKELTNPMKGGTKILKQLIAGMGAIAQDGLSSNLSKLIPNKYITALAQMILGHFGAGAIKSDTISAFLTGLGVSADKEMVLLIKNQIDSMKNKNKPAASSAGLEPTGASYTYESEEF